MDVKIGSEWVCNASGWVRQVRDIRTAADGTQEIGSKAIVAPGSEETHDGTPHLTYQPIDEFIASVTPVTA